MSNTDSRHRKPIRAALMAYFAAHPGEVVYLPALAQALGESAERCQQGIANLVNPNRGTPDLPLQVVVRGQAWKHTPDGAPEAEPSRRLFEAIGASKDGSLILECEDGKFYRAVEL